MRTHSVLASTIAAIGFVLVPLGAVLVARAPFTEDLRTLARVRARPLVGEGKRVPEGPVALRGHVAHATDVTAPSGESGSAWMAWVGSWVGQGKSRHFEVACELGDASQLVVDVGGEALRFAPGGARLRAATGNTFPIHDGGELFLDLDAVTHASAGAESRVPPAVRAACGALPSAPLYRETVLRPGGEVDVVACRRGDRLEPCGDGFDYVTSGSLAQRVEQAREERAGGLLLLTVIAGAILAVAGFGGARAMVPSRAAPEEAA